jgi:hypothetical protein
MVQVLARYSSRFLGTSTSWGGEVGICAAEVLNKFVEQFLSINLCHLLAAVNFSLYFITAVEFHVERSD